VDLRLVTWKSYQIDTGTKPKLRIPRGFGRGLLLTFGGFLLLFFGYRALWPTETVSLENPATAVCDVSGKIELGKKWDRCVFSRLLPPAMLREGPREVVWNDDTRHWAAELSFDPDLQRFIQKKLKDYRVDWGGVAVVDPSTGEILALASHSEKGWNDGNLALRATFPAASIFKIVTATAALEENLVERTSTFRYRLRFRRDEGTIRRSDLLKEGGNNEVTVEEAFAKSENKVFGKIGLRIGGPRLLDYAQRFGFNSDIPFEFPADWSKAGSSGGEETDEDEDIVEQARLAAGFQGATLSPLHGAMIAGAVANGGKMMLPHLVRRVTEEGGRDVYRAQPTVWTTPMSEGTSRELRLMMEKTISRGGTAHRGFRKLERDRTLNKLDIGGKTGSLTGKNPPGKNLWFVGYAQGYDRTIAIGIVLVHDRIWRVKPSRLSREIMDFYFTPRPVVQVRAKGPAHG
jgi:penicillin-binding protein A